MARYPGLVKSRINIDARPIAAAFAPEAQLEDTRPGSAEGETAELNPTQVARYPRYKAPGFWGRLLDPEGARDIQRFNYESGVREAGDVAEINKLGVANRFQKELEDHRLEMQALRNVLKREGFTPDQIEEAVVQSTADKLNKLKLGNVTSAAELNAAESNRPKIQANYLAGLDKQGIINEGIKADTAIKGAELPWIGAGRQADIEATRAATANRGILNKFLPRREEAEIQNLEEQYRGMNQRYDQSALMFPIERDIAASKARDASMIHLQPGSVYGNVPAMADGSPINWTAIQPETRATTGEYEIFEDPATGEKKFRKTPATPAQPPSMHPLGNMDQIINRPTTGTTAPMEYEYKDDPATGKRYRRPIVR